MKTSSVYIAQVILMCFLVRKVHLPAPYTRHHPLTERRLVVVDVVVQKPSVCQSSACPFSSAQTYAPEKSGILSDCIHFYVLLRTNGHQKEAFLPFRLLTTAPEF